MTRFTLSLVDEYPYQLMGISTSLPPYRLAWLLNKSLELNLCMCEAVEMAGKQKPHALFTRYEGRGADEHAIFRLVQNKNKGSFLLQEQKGADYLMVIDESPELDPQAILTDIRAIQGINLAFAIELEKLKQKQNVLLTI